MKTGARAFEVFFSGRGQRDQEEPRNLCQLQMGEVAKFQPDWIWHRIHCVYILEEQRNLPPPRVAAAVNHWLAQGGPLGGWVIPRLAVYSLGDPEQC